MNTRVDRITQLKRLLRIALAIGLSSLINLTINSSETNGFVVAIDVVVFTVIMYAYREMWVMNVAILAAITSPLARMLTMLSVTEDVADSAAQTLPDGVFFLTFGMVYCFIMHYGFKDDSDLANYIICILFSDIAGNLAELLLRSAMLGHFTFTEPLIGITVFTASARTALTYAVIALIDWYSDTRLFAERQREYHDLLRNATVIQDEIQIMNKNMAEVEDVMKKGYELYNQLDSGGYPEQIVGQSLELTKLIHEIKGDYRNVITVLSGLYEDDLAGRKTMSLAEIINIEKLQAEALIRDKGYDIEVDCNVSGDAEVSYVYKMLSVIRNLLTNSIEAIAGEAESAGAGAPHRKGIVSLTAVVDEADGKAGRITIDAVDNGPGIPERKRDKIFNAGYSTKFDSRTGYIQRGLGLPVVKSYVENDMGGTIELVDEGKRGAHFRIVIPGGNKRDDEVLHS